MLADNKTDVTLLICLYFSIALVELVARYAVYCPLIFLCGIIAPVLLAVIYRITSEKRNLFFFIIVMLSLLANILLFCSNPAYFSVATMLSIVQKIVMLGLVIGHNNERSYGRVLLAAIPFLVIFYYLNSITSEYNTIEFNSLFFQSFLISLLSGSALSSYLKNDNRENSWLLISTLLFVGLQFVVLIERYYFSVISLSVFNLIGIILNSFGFFTFYKFISAAEKRDLYITN